MHIKKGDQVIVIAGNDKGTKGRVLKVFRKERRIVVENVAFAKRATRPNPSKGQQGGLVEKELPIHISNVMLIDPKSGEPTRISLQCLADGKKMRISKKSGEEIPVTK